MIFEGEIKIADKTYTCSYAIDESMFKLSGINKTDLIFISEQRVKEMLSRKIADHVVIKHIQDKLWN